MAGLLMGGEPIIWYAADSHHVVHMDEIVYYVTPAWYPPAQQSNITSAAMRQSSSPSRSVTLAFVWTSAGRVEQRGMRDEMSDEMSAETSADMRDETRADMSAEKSAELRDEMSTGMSAEMRDVETPR